MRKTTIAAGLAATLVLTGCNAVKSGPPPKRQPGSWTTKINLVRIEGKDADKAKAGLEQMFAQMSNVSVCLTPEAVAKDDPMQNFDKFGGGNGNCTFEKKDVSAAGLHVAGTCKNPNGKTVKITGDGTLGATDQELTMKVEGFDATGQSEGLMEMHAHSVRGGDCKPTDMKAPAGTPM